MRIRLEKPRENEISVVDGDDWMCSRDCPHFCVDNYEPNNIMDASKCVIYCGLIGEHGFTYRENKSGYGDPIRSEDCRKLAPPTGELASPYGTFHLSKGGQEIRIGTRNYTHTETSKGGRRV